MTNNQQMSENKVIDARSFAEIWEGCTEIQRSFMTAKITEKLGCSSVAVWNYGKGNYAPRTLSAKKDVVRVVRAVLEINTTPESLFPSN